MSSKIINLQELPKELYSAHSNKGIVLFRYGNDVLEIQTIREKSNVADINGSLYYFGNTYGNINPYKRIKSLDDLYAFTSLLSDGIDRLAIGKVTDVLYLNVSELMNQDIIAEKILTVQDVVYPDYLVELPEKEQFTIEIDEKNSIISTKDQIKIEKVGSFDLKKLFKMEYLNSLYIVKLAHNRELDLRGIMFLLPQLEKKGLIDIVQINDSRYYLTVALHIPEDLLKKVFSYKLKARLANVRVDDITQFYISKSIKR